MTWYRVKTAFWRIWGVVVYGVGMACLAWSALDRVPGTWVRMWESHAAGDSQAVSAFGLALLFEVFVASIAVLIGASMTWWVLFVATDAEINCEKAS